MRFESVPADGWFIVDQKLYVKRSATHAVRVSLAQVGEAFKLEEEVLSLDMGVRDAER